MVRILWACFVIQQTGEGLWVPSFPAPLPPVLLSVGSCLQARRRFAAAGCAEELWSGLFANTAQQSLFTMTASYSGTHGPARGDCKLCNSAVKQRGIMAKRKGQTVDGSLGPKCECADLGCAAINGRKVFSNWESREAPSQGYLWEWVLLFLKFKCSFQTLFTNSGRVSETRRNIYKRQ